MVSSDVRLNKGSLILTMTLCLEVNDIMTLNRDHVQKKGKMFSGYKFSPCLNFRMIKQRANFQKLET